MSKISGACALGFGFLACAAPANAPQSGTVREERAAASAGPHVPAASIERTGSVLLALGGDVNLGRACGQRLLQDPSFDPFRGVSALWNDADLRFVNLEAPLSDQDGQTQSPHHALVFTGPPSGAEALAQAGIGLVSTANNHAWDYGLRGLSETLFNLDRMGIAHAGTGSDEASAYRPALVQINGFSIALFAVTQVWNLGAFSEVEAHRHVAWADAPRLRDAIRKARAAFDFVLVSYHGGEEYTDVPARRVREFTEEMMKLGVDALIGHHPHVLEGVAFHGSHPLFYSLGNLVFDARSDKPETRLSAIFKLRLRPGRAAEVHACPIVIDGYQPRALFAVERDKRRAFAEHLRIISERVGGSAVGNEDDQGCFTLSAPLPAPRPRARFRTGRGSALSTLR